MTRVQCGLVWSLAILLAWPSPAQGSSCFCVERAPSLRLGALAGRGAETVLFVAPSLEASTRFTTAIFHVNSADPALEADEQFLQLDFGLALGRVFQDADKEAEPFVYSPWMSFDADIYPFKARAADSKSFLKRFSVGGRIGKDYTEIDGASDHALLRREAAAMLTWRNSVGVGSGSCELDNVVVNYASNDYDERAAGVAADSDRSGSRTRYGAEVTLYQREVKAIEGEAKKPYSIDHRCTRRGPFYRYHPVEYRVWRLGYDHEDADTDGTEVGGEFERAYVGGEWPISEPGTKDFWSIGAQAEYTRVRNDHGGYGEVVLRRFLSAWSEKRHVDAQIGVSRTLDNLNTPDVKDDHWRIFAGLDFWFAPRSNRFLPEGAASQTVQAGARSGSSSTEVQGGLR